MLGQHMVQAAGADVVGPPAAAYDPEAPAHQVLCECVEVPGRPVGRLLQRAAKRLAPRPLGHDLAAGALGPIEDPRVPPRPDAIETGSASCRARVWQDV